MVLQPQKVSQAKCGGMMEYKYKLNTEQVSQEDYHEFETRLDFRVSTKPAKAMYHKPISKAKRTKTK